MSSQSEKLLGEDATDACSLLDWTSHYLINSRDQPLEIVLQSPRDNHTDIYECMDPLIDMLVEESQRWKRVHLSLPGVQMETLDLDETLPVLEFLHLHVNNFPLFVYGIPTFATPQLQELIISAVSFPLSSELPEFEFLASLTKLRLYHVSVYSTLHYLSQAPLNLSVNAYLAFEYDGPLVTAPIVSHIDTLTTLSAGDLTIAECNDPLGDLFNNISSLPNIHLFDFTGNECQGRPFPHTSFISFLSRRRPDETPITKLSLKEWLLKDDFLVQILDLLPALEHLTIDENFRPARLAPWIYKSRDRTLSSSFLRALQIPTSNSICKCLLPRLTNLTLIFEMKVDYQAMKNMIQSRRGNLRLVSRLDWVSISVPRRLVDIKNVRALRTMGDVVVKLV
ncbi:hypothetical protein VKT23_018291 [Stygiomarasmius scandens]|uniref:F-box domain-containing protein n=1 Tax=Marasmiellus scandens TaxID=2682957 RepID=A0ABR1IS96_9AGAR